MTRDEVRAVFFALFLVYFFLTDNIGGKLGAAIIMGGMMRDGI